MTLVQTELKKIYIRVDEPLPDYLCFTANTDGSTIYIYREGSPASVTFETSTDGSSWSTYTFSGSNGTTITLNNIGDKVYFRNSSETDTQLNKSSSDYYYFKMTGNISASGNVMYLLNKNGTTTLSNWCFYNLFYSCSALKQAPSLPATTLANYCYRQMFASCDLLDIPELPATTLAQGCYYSMFYGNINLEKLPNLPVTNLPDECYYRMFSVCYKIKLNTSQTGIYQTPYRIPTTGTGTEGMFSLQDMFASTGGSWSGTPSINTTYYTSNTLV